MDSAGLYKPPPCTICIGSSDIVQEILHEGDDCKWHVKSRDMIALKRGLTTLGVATSLEATEFVSDEDYAGPETRSIG